MAIEYISCHRDGEAHLLTVKYCGEIFGWGLDSSMVMREGLLCAIRATINLGAFILNLPDFNKEDNKELDALEAAYSLLKEKKDGD